MTQWRDKKRGDWRYHFKKNGVRYAGGGFATMKESAAAEAKRREEIKSIPTSTATDFLIVSNAYLDDAERRMVHQTYLNKRLVFSRFMERMGNVDMASVTPQEINKGYLLALDTNSKYNVHRKELSSLWEWAIRTMKIRMVNPILDIRPLPHSRADKVIPTQEEVVKIILAARPGHEQDIIVTILHTMGRINEVLRLKWSDVNFDKRTVTLWTRKRKGGSMEADTLPMSHDLYDLMMKRWKARKQDEWVFWSEAYKNHFTRNKNTMKGVCKRAKVPLYGFHSLRHFMASYHADELKTSLTAISKLLRHKSRRTTELYLHTIDESVREAVDKQANLSKAQAEDAIRSEKAND